MGLVNQVLQDLKSRGVGTERFFEPAAIKRVIQVPLVIEVAVYALLFLMIGFTFYKMTQAENLGFLKILEKHNIVTVADVNNPWDSLQVAEPAKHEIIHTPKEPSLLTFSAGNISDFIQTEPSLKVLEETNLAKNTKTSVKQDLAPKTNVLSRAANEFWGVELEKMNQKIALFPNKAIEISEDFFAANPQNMLIREKLAQYYLDANLAEKASPIIEANLKLSPENPVFLSQKIAYLLKKEGTESALDFLETLSLNPQQQPEILSLKATLYQKTSRHTLAIETYRKLISEYPNDPRYWMGVGLSLEAHGKLEMARDSFMRAQEKSKSSPSLEKFVSEKLSTLDKELS